MCGSANMEVVETPGSGLNVRRGSTLNHVIWVNYGKS